MIRQIAKIPPISSEIAEKTESFSTKGMPEGSVQQAGAESSQSVSTNGTLINANVMQGTLGEGLSQIVQNPMQSALNEAMTQVNQNSMQNISTESMVQTNSMENIQFFPTTAENRGEDIQTPVKNSMDSIMTSQMSEADGEISQMLTYDTEKMSAQGNLIGKNGAESTSSAINKDIENVQKKETIAEQLPNTEHTTSEMTEEPIAQKNTELSSQKQVLRLIHHLFGETGIHKEDSPSVLLHKLSHFIANGENVSKDALNQLFSSKDMRQFLRDVMEGQMYLKPQDVADAQKVEKLYERLENKTQNIQNLLNSAGLRETPLAQTVADVHNNIDFMNQLNQTFTYVQIPLKMTGQNASGQLYVYTKKRDLNDSDKELTAFLHLDLEHLGSTDVSVRLYQKKVDTKFYIDNDMSYALIQKHMPELEERLRCKGYNCNIYLEKEGKQVNFVEDFLKKDAPSTEQLHRYSFDVRA